jgi:hypothetical protein
MSRVTLLNQLINMSSSMELINKKLERSYWGMKEKLETLEKHHVLRTLQRFVDAEITLREIESWAQAIECCEDIGREEKYQKIMDEIIFEIANQGISTKLSKTRAKELIAELI